MKKFFQKIRRVGLVGLVGLGLATGIKVNAQTVAPRISQLCTNLLITNGQTWTLNIPTNVLLNFSSAHQMSVFALLQSTNAAMFTSNLTMKLAWQLGSGTAAIGYATNNPWSWTLQWSGAATNLYATNIPTYWFDSTTSTELWQVSTTATNVNGGLLSLWIGQTP